MNRLHAFADARGTTSSGTHQSTSDAGGQTPTRSPVFRTNRTEQWGEKTTKYVASLHNPHNLLSKAACGENFGVMGAALFGECRGVHCISREGVDALVGDGRCLSDPPAAGSSARPGAIRLGVGGRRRRTARMPRPRREQIVEVDGQVCVIRDVRVIGQVVSLLDSPAREFALALTDAVDYIAKLVAGDERRARCTYAPETNWPTPRTTARRN